MNHWEGVIPLICRVILAPVVAIVTAAAAAAVATGAPSAAAVVWQPQASTVIWFRAHDYRSHLSEGDSSINNSFSNNRVIETADHFSNT